MTDQLNIAIVSKIELAEDVSNMRQSKVLDIEDFLYLLRSDSVSLLRPTGFEIDIFNKVQVI